MTTALAPSSVSVSKLQPRQLLKIPTPSRTGVHPRQAQLLHEQGKQATKSDEVLLHTSVADLDGSLSRSPPPEMQNVRVEHIVEELKLHAGEEPFGNRCRKDLTYEAYTSTAASSALPGVTPAGTTPCLSSAASSRPGSSSLVGGRSSGCSSRDPLSSARRSEALLSSRETTRAGSVVSAAAPLGSSRRRASVTGHPPLIASKGPPHPRRLAAASPSPGKAKTVAPDASSAGIPRGRLDSRARSLPSLPRASPSPSPPPGSTSAANAMAGSGGATSSGGQRLSMRAALGGCLL